jgi:hypothetical protein
LDSPKVQRHTANKSVMKIIYVPEEVINIVVK